MSDSTYLDQIRQLVELQKVDDEIFSVKGELENAPRDLTELERNFAAVEARRNHIKDKIDHLKEQKKRISLEIDDDYAKIKKSKNKMMQVSNDKEHQAVLREMDSMEKSNRTREEEKMAVLEELQIQTDKLNEIDVEYNELKASRDAKRASLDEVLQMARDKLARLNKQREEFSRGVPAGIFQNYEFIRKRLEHPVIVAVDEGVCSGCHIAIPPQAFIELQTGQHIQNCPNCQRLIYWSEHFEDPLHPVQKGKKLERKSGEPADKNSNGENEETGMELSEEADVMDE